ncbi:rod-determining factor RdfA [Halosegnis sp.]|uniref:rod-determining factor RdfA n=1 Tax=Halosegnis sp. TaxID=2864959 RepID=UPI0035D42645
MVSERTDGCKIDRVAERRSLANIDDRLRTRRRDGASLRALATFYNQSVLRAAMEGAEMEPLDGEVENLHRLLTDEDVTAGARVDAEARLSRNGVDPAAVTDDFVSHVTVQNHLTDCLGMTTDTQLTDAVDARESVMKLRSRLATVAESTLERLSRRGDIAVTTPSVTVSLRVNCAECNDAYSFSRLLDRGGCSCHR